MFLIPMLAALPLLRPASDVARIAYRDETTGVTFRVEGTVLRPCTHEGGRLSLEDDSGAVSLLEHKCWPELGAFKSGDRIRATGFTKAADRHGHVNALVVTADLLAHGEAPKPIDVTIADIAAGKVDFRLVSATGVVRDVFRDDIEYDCCHLVLSHDGKSVCAYLAERDSPTALDALIGAEIRVTGCCHPPLGASRTYIGRGISLDRSDAARIEILRPAPTDPFSAPALKDFKDLTPAAIAALGRHRTGGRVLAVLNRGGFLLRRDNGQLARVTPALGNLPHVGDLLDVVGFPETDLYRINLSGAIWRRSATTSAPDDPPALALAAHELTADENGHPRFAVWLHGRLIRLSGTVASATAVGHARGTLHLETDGQLVTVDGSSVAEAVLAIPVGSRIEVTGVCVMETENWRPNLAIPRIGGYVLVPRTADDIRIVSRPPWWTPARLIVVIGSLLALLVAIGIWNRVLRQLVERKGRALFKEQIARAGADMRTEERTRLAVELHDAISQNLSGASMQIDAAERTLDRNRDKTLRHLNIASKTLTSCREELHNCIWDLRNQALDETDMNAAIRKTLLQHVGDAELVIRFNVPRARLSDNTAHALLRIIRELVVNAVRHGNAKSVRVAGTLEDGKLLFSVTDDGCGFDPETRPGIPEGHFGLQGVAERIRPLGGTMSVDSAPGRGTRIALSLNTPKVSDNG